MYAYGIHSLAGKVQCRCLLNKIVTVLFQALLDQEHHLADLVPTATANLHRNFPLMAPAVAENWLAYAQRIAAPVYAYLRKRFDNERDLKPTMRALEQARFFDPTNVGQDMALDVAKLVSCDCVAFLLLCFN